MELLAYIQEEFTYADDAIASEIPETFQESFKKLTNKSAKLSFGVLLTGTTLLIGLGSTLNALAAEAPSSDVKYVQSLLAQNGFDPGAIDGVAGASTKNAILRAQKAFGLTPDGVVGSRTIAALQDGKAVDLATKVDVADTTVAVNETTTRASSTVMNLQKLLADRGFYNGAVDGIMGTQTRTAIIAAQKAYNLTADGVAGPQTLAALESDGGQSTATTNISTTTSTAKSAEVSNLQELLSKRGFYNGAVDGIMGSQTRSAIVAAQKNYGLVTDGVAGAKTLAALESGASPVSIASKNPETPASTATATASDKDIASLQQLLAKRGFYNGAIDGVKGAQTNAAIAAAQKSYGLTTDGIAGAQTIAALQADARPSAAVTPVSNQAAKTVTTANDGGVANLQNLLTDRGFYNGPITGFLGTRTREAIIAAQKAYGLTADGVAGARTIAALEAGAPRQQIAATNVIPAPTPTIRVEPKPQVTPQPTAQPQAVVTPKPQPTIQATPKPTTAPVAQPTKAPVAQPTTTPVAQPTKAPATTANNQVSELQRLLAQRGFYTGKVDGVLSGETRNAIIRAQNFYTISPADGTPSNKLIDSLSKDTFISEGN